MANPIKHHDRRRRPGSAIAVGLLCGVVMLGAVPGAPAVATSGPQEQAADRSTRGMVYSGLHTDPSGSCGTAFEVAAEAADGTALCTHGPDPAPRGIDIRDAEGKLWERGPEGAAAATDVPCIGAGTGGARVQAIYAVASDRPDRFTQLADSIRTWAGHVQETVAVSAAETGGVRNVRFLTEPIATGCRVALTRVVLSPTGDDTFARTIGELAAQGFTRSDRRYLVWVDANVYCGIATVRLDDRASAQNANNGLFPAYSRIDAPCWGLYQALPNLGSVEAHELMHNIGGVQTSAPNATPFNHCTDDADLMCYNDGSGAPVRPDVCPVAHEPYFDCNHDDYFHTNPPAGSYLATRWNPARSSFLDGPGTFALAVPQHSRAVSLTAITRRLVLRGRVVTLNGYGSCSSNVPVRLQRRSGTSWRTILSRRTRATGAFGLQLPRRTGTYRAFAPRTTVDVTHRCLAAASFSVRLRVR